MLGPALECRTKTHELRAKAFVDARPHIRLQYVSANRDLGWEQGQTRGPPKRLALIAAGYVLAVVGGFAAVAVNELFMPADVAQGSPGMVAFGDMILFVLVAGLLGLAPTWFLLKLWSRRRRAPSWPPCC